MTSFVHQTLFDVNDRRDFWDGTRPSIRIEIIRVIRCHVTMIDVGHHPHRNGHVSSRQPVLKRNAFGNGLPKFAGDAHRFPENIVQTGGFSVLGNFGPTINSDFNHVLTRRGVILLPVGQDGKLRSHRGSTEIRNNVSKRLKPINIIASNVNIGMTKVVQAPIRARHTRRHAHTGAPHCGPHLPRKPSNHRRRPGRIDEFMGKLKITNAQITCHAVNQVIGIRKTVHQRIGVKRKAQGHQEATAYVVSNHSVNVEISTSVISSRCLVRRQIISSAVIAHSFSTSQLTSAS